jgi:hypothetical protein
MSRWEGFSIFLQGTDQWPGELGSGMSENENSSFIKINPSGGLPRRSIHRQVYINHCSPGLHQDCTTPPFPHLPIDITTKIISYEHHYGRIQECDCGISLVYLVVMISYFDTRARVHNFYRRERQRGKCTMTDFPTSKSWNFTMCCIVVLPAPLRPTLLLVAVNFLIIISL